MIYFIRQAGSNFIKVGYTANMVTLKDRLRTLNVGNPNSLEVFRVFKGEPSQEKAIHQKFQIYHVHGEWFELPDEVIQELKDYGTVLDIKVTGTRTLSKAEKSHSRKLTIFDNILNTMQICQGYVDYSTFIECSFLSPRASSPYWKELKDKYKVKDKSKESLVLGRQPDTITRDKVLSTISTWMSKGKPILSSCLAESLNMKYSSVEIHKQLMRKDIDSYHLNLFGSKHHNTIKNRYELLEAINKLGATGLNLSSLARKLGVHFNTINKHKDFIREKAPEVLINSSKNK